MNPGLRQQLDRPDVLANWEPERDELENLERRRNCTAVQAVGARESGQDAVALEQSVSRNAVDSVVDGRKRRVVTRVLREMCCNQHAGVTGVPIRAHGRGHRRTDSRVSLTVSSVSSGRS